LSTTELGENLVFFRHWLRHPLRIGAILPSGGEVARAMAQALPLAAPGLVLELGGGTGSLTRALIEAGCPQARLVVIEREPELASLLRRRFPAARVIAADARLLGRVLAELDDAHLAGVVSSLPIKWFPVEDQRAVVMPCFDHLDRQGAFLQLTNAFASPLAAAELALAGAEVARVWSHLPPVQIWRYWRA
jgi:phosphatidylethanolamine/phosphatidyl-N-methylethanolamine N-methyltransferase